MKKKRVKKALGADIKNFYETAWPEGYYHDDNEIDIEDENGRGVLEDTESYSLALFGKLYNEDGEAHLTFSEAFNEWYGKQGLTTFLVRVPDEEADTFEETITSGGKVWIDNYKRVKK